MRNVKKYFLAVLVFISLNSNVFAFFVTDIQAIAQQIVSHVKEIENYYAEGMRWVQQVEQFKNQLKQIEKYYQQLQRLGPEAWKDPEAVLGAVKGMAGAVDKACGQVNALLNTSDETIEDVNLWINTTRIQIEKNIASMYDGYSVGTGAINTSESIQTIANNSKKIIDTLNSQIESLTKDINENLNKEVDECKKSINKAREGYQKAADSLKAEALKGDSASQSVIDDYDIQMKQYAENRGVLEATLEELMENITKTVDKIRELVKIRSIVEVISDNSSFRSTGYASMQKLRDAFSKYSGGSGKADYDDLLKRMNL